MAPRWSRVDRHGRLGFSAAPHLLDLGSSAGFIVDAPMVPLHLDSGEVITDTEYVGNRLVVGSICCPHWARHATARLAVRSPNSGARTTVVSSARGELFVLTARSDSRLRFLRTGVNGLSAGQLWALDRPGGVPLRVGGRFLAIDW